MSHVARSRLQFALLLLLFVGSGCAALIYEIVWFQLLQLVIGSSAVSLAVLLGTFMGGMCLGSWVLPRLTSELLHPLRVYAWLELGIGVTGLAVLLAMPFVAEIYTSLVGHGYSGILLRAGVCVVCLLPPTLLMGATLPAIARWLDSTRQGVSWLGYFYGANTVGAVIGCLLAGFYLLRVYDVATATFWAVGLNLVIAALACVLAHAMPPRRYEPVVVDPAAPESAVEAFLADLSPEQRDPVRDVPWVLVTIALSGFCALAAEVIWVRVLSLLLGATVYTFAIILAVFLAGLGIGSSIGAAIARKSPYAREVFGVCQGMQIGTIVWAAHTITFTLPNWPLDEASAAIPAAKFGFDLLRCACAIMPAAILWGASFPLALAATARPDHDTGRLVSRIYASNTLGAIAGAVLTSMVLIPLLGTQYTQIALIILSALGPCIALRPGTFLTIVTTGAGAMVAFMFIPPASWQLVAYGRHVATTDYGAKAIYFGEGMNASVAVSETPGGARFFHVSGKTEASSLEKDMRLQRMLGHIPALLHPNPRSVLIVGCGAGVTAGTFVLHPSIERIVICDIEPLIPQVVATYFREENHDVLRDPRVTIVHDDARHYIATTQEKFDLITSDPIHPWVKGSAVLYSREYFELCRKRLNPGGLVSQWVPLYESNRAVVQSEIATFFSVFPHGTIWANDDEGFGYDTVLLGQAEPLAVDIDHLHGRFERSDHARARAALSGLGLGSAVSLLSTYAGQFSDLKTWLGSAEINRDRNLRLQYLAGLELDSRKGADAYAEILSHRRFPSDIIRGGASRINELQRMWEVGLEGRQP